MQKLKHTKKLGYIFSLLILVIVIANCVKSLKEIKPFEVQKLLAEDHPIRESYESYAKKYNDENQVFILFKKSEKFNSRELSKISREVSKFLDRVEYTRNISSFENAKYVSFDKTGFQLKKFIENEKISDEADRALRSELWSKSLISEDFKSMIIGLSLSNLIPEKKKVPTVSKIMDLVNKWSSENIPNVEIHYLGTEVANYYFTLEMKKNQTVITPLLLLLIGTFFFFLFKSVATVLWSYYVIILSYALTITLIVLTEDGIGPYSSFALFFVLIISTSDLVHFFSGLNDTNGDIEKTVKKLIKPCFLTTLTTAVGFLSLVLNENVPVRFFGFYCAVGTIGCFLITYFLLPALLRVTEYKTKTSKQLSLNASFIWKIIENHSRKILFIFSALVILFLYESLTVKIDDNLYRKFQNYHPMTKSVDAFSDGLNYVGSVDLLIRDKNLSGEIISQKNITLIKKLEKDLIKVQNVSHMKSYSQMDDYVSSVIKDFKNSEDLILKKAFLDLMNTYQVTGSFYNSFANELRTVLFLNSLNSTELENTINEIKKITGNKAYENLDVEVSGFAAIRSYVNNSVIRNFIKSFAFSFMVIFIIFLVIYRSLKWATLAILPNILPLLTISGLMGLFNITVESNLVILVCVTMGLSVDDTIHFIYNLKNSLKKGLPLKNSVENSLKETAKALIGTTSVLVFSFPCFLLADLKLFVQVGVFILISLIVALIADFLLLPSLLLKFNLVGRVSKGDSTNANHNHNDSKNLV